MMNNCNVSWFSDIDECAEDVCPAPGSCINNVGGFNCSCSGSGDLAILSSGINTIVLLEKITNNAFTAVYFNHTSCNTYFYSFFCYSGKNVNMSTTLGCVAGYCFGGDKLVDGIINPRRANPPRPKLYSLGITLIEMSPWILIDLDMAFCIEKVIVYNRRRGYRDCK